MKKTILVIAALLLLSAIGCVNADPMMGDFNQNGRLDYNDIVGFNNYLYNPNAPYLPYMDLNGNGRMDSQDLSILVSMFD